MTYWGSFCTFGGRDGEPIVSAQGHFLDFAHDYPGIAGWEDEPGGADGLIQVLAEDETGMVKVWITRPQAAKLRDALTEELARPYP